MEWIDIKKRLPDGHSELRPEECEVIGFNENWIDPDFNPNGTRVCCYSDAGWNCAKWVDYQDYYSSIWSQDDKDAIPTHWLPMPVKPNKKLQKAQKETL